MSTQNTALKFQIEDMLLENFEKFEKEAEGVLWDGVLFTQPMTTF